MSATATAVPAQVALAIKEAFQPEGFCQAFEEAAEAYEKREGKAFPVSQSQLATMLRDDPPAGELRFALRRSLASWDNAPAGKPWTCQTVARTLERRERVMEVLALETELDEAIRELLPPKLHSPALVLSGRSDSGPSADWYPDEDSGVIRSFYWPHLQEHLRVNRQWDLNSLEDLAVQTREAMKLLADPVAAEPESRKGLVVGHVQSGKTAHFAGLIARSVDAGYRLIIVISGRTDLLRNQTQLRLDQDLVGSDQIIADAEGDPDNGSLAFQPAGSYVEHGSLETIREDGCEIQRLTDKDSDYRRLGAGILALDFRTEDGEPRYNTQANLATSPARLIVVKKHASRINSIRKDIETLTAGAGFDHVPTLIIDDESDEASINTRGLSHSRREESQRSSVNQAIVSLLSRLPRAQYVGYTATPFASVLVDANDSEDLFPKDFILALEPSQQYCGASAFHDLDGEPEGSDENPFRSNTQCFIRDVTGDDSQEPNLPTAIDSFVLTGAIKLWREANSGAVATRHHTMLINSSARIADHQEMASLVKKVFSENSYSAPRTINRLERLWRHDFKRVCTELMIRPGDEAEAPASPESWEELIPYIGPTVERILGAEGPVLIVNGTKESVTPKFDEESIWKVIVGGAKLSRGFTVEGLTISYFRRRTSTADTLMQMGRWFGYRRGYKDLVRLYIDRKAPGPGNKTFDLLEAFEGACKDELLFREELNRYQVLAGEERLKPIQVPPLVRSTLPWLPATSASKMKYAKLEFENFGGRSREPTFIAGTSLALRHNAENMQKLLEGIDGASDLVENVRARENAFNAFVFTVSPSEMLETLERHQWPRLTGGEEAKPLETVLEFLKGEGDRDPEIDSWLVIAPQLREPGPCGLWEVGGSQLTVKYRAWATKRTVKAFSEPAHVAVANGLTGVGSLVTDSGVEQFKADRTAVMLLYPTRHEFATSGLPLSPPTMGFRLHFPANSMPSKLGWRAQAEDGKTTASDISH